jgi:hypothetical protein
MTKETLLNTVRDALAIFTKKTGWKARCQLFVGGCGAFVVGVFIGDDSGVTFSVSQSEAGSFQTDPEPLCRSSVSYTAWKIIATELRKKESEYDFFSSLSYEKKVGLTFYVDGDDELDPDCFCKAIGTDEVPRIPDYVLHVNCKGPVTEYTVFDLLEEKYVDLQTVLDKYGVYDWTDLPFLDGWGCCKICRNIFDCETVKKAVEEHENSKKPER